MRREIFSVIILLLLCSGLLAKWFPFFWWVVVVVGAIGLLALYDTMQNQHTIIRNFPVIGHFRYLFESIRPEISQYFIESDTNGAPISREHRSIVYQRAKKERDTVPFGTKRNVYEEGYEWVHHSLNPVKINPDCLRVTIGNEMCSQPYSISVLNVSAMSYGSLSSHAIEALNIAARLENFAHNTGEGGVSSYHLKHGGDLIWQIGTGYFGAREKDGGFSPSKFKENACRESVKMIELKLSQGAKPGHGGILPAAKITREIANIRNVPMGEDVLSPPGHREFSNSIEMMQFVQRLRELCDGKPVGMKLCVGHPDEFRAICEAMVETKIYPDYLHIDGGEGGTGAAPLEYSNSVGMPLSEGLVFANKILTKLGLRNQIKILASGKIITGFHMIKTLSLGADVCMSARAMMLALGCIQALRCNSNDCPTGVATNKPSLVKGLHIKDKSLRVAQYHAQTLKSVSELLGSMGMEDFTQLSLSHIYRRTGPLDIHTYEDLYKALGADDLLSLRVPSQNIRQSAAFRKE